MKNLMIIPILFFICSCSQNKEVSREEKSYVKIHSALGALPDTTYIGFIPEDTGHSLKYEMTLNEIREHNAGLRKKCETNFIEYTPSRSKIEYKVIHQ